MISCKGSDVPDDVGTHPVQPRRKPPMFGTHPLRPVLHLLKGPSIALHPLEKKISSLGPTGRRQLHCNVDCELNQVSPGLQVLAECQWRWEGKNPNAIKIPCRRWCTLNQYRFNRCLLFFSWRAFICGVKQPQEACRVPAPLCRAWWQWP